MGAPAACKRRDDPFRLSAVARCALLHENAEEYVEALAAYRRAAARPEAGPGVFVNLGILLAETEDWEGSLGAFEKALSLGARYPQAYLGRATALQRLGRREEARAAAREGLRHFPEDPGLAALAG